jgi:hypothetical protein
MRGKETLAMVRSLGIAAVVVGLAWTGLAGAQSVPPGTAAPRERYMTVREEGKPPQRCKLLKTWHEADGSTAFQVQAVDSGELITIVQSGSAPTESGGHKTVASRIFHWGPENKPSAQTPVPPPNATVLGTPMGQTGSSSAPAQSAPPAAAPPASVSAQFATMPHKPESATLTARAPAPTPTATVPAPILPQPLPPKSAAPSYSPTTIVVTPKTDSPSKNDSTAATTDVTTKAAPTLQPRLVPTTSGNAGCTTPCSPCCQSSCACCTPAPLRQTWLNRIFKSHASSTAVACQPATCMPAPLPPAVAKAAVEPARPSDWRESWGKVEPWKGAPTATADQSDEEVSKHMARAPIEAPKQADPLKDPDWYRGMALKEKPHSSYAPDMNAGPAPPHGEQKAALPPGAEEMMSPSTVPGGPPTPGRVITLSADEGNAFWTPPAPPRREKKGKRGQTEEPEQPEPNEPRYNAFDRESNAPPPNPAAAMMRGPHGPMPMVPQGMGPMGMGGPGMGPMGMGVPGLPVAMQGMPPPPPGPMPYLPPGPRMPSLPADMGVPSAMANAFTVAGTRRPIPADFGGTPQEPNGFGSSDVNVEGPAHPPQAYGMQPMPGAPMPPGMMPMTPPQGPVVGMNPLMAVPPTPVAATKTRGLHDSESVPQLLASLKDSQLPSQREWAAEQLSELNWRQQPYIADSLARSAKEDPAASVRAACVHALAHLKVDKPEVVAVVQELRNDRDPRVRSEVEEALSTLVTAPQQDTGIRPASHR